MRPVAEVLRDLTEATDALKTDISRLTDAVTRGPSSLPRWSRGHVLTHLARNAEGGSRLLEAARTAVPGFEYESVEAREAAIEAGAWRPAAVLAADVRATADTLAERAALMPEQAWQNPVTWATGQQTPAQMVIRSRLAEVLIHHVDLAIGFGPDSWPAAFVGEMLDAAVNALGGRRPAPFSASLEAHDTGRTFAVGDEDDGRRLRGTEARLLAWLLGRSDGAGLADDDAGPLPAVPSVYLT